MFISNVSRGGDLIAIICHFFSFYMGPSVLYSSLVIQNRIKKNFWKNIIFKPPTRGVPKMAISHCKNSHKSTEFTNWLETLPKVVNA